MNHLSVDRNPESKLDAAVLAELAARGFVHSPLHRGSLPHAARLAQINAVEPISDQCREMYLAGLNARYDAGLLTGVSFMGPQGTFIGFGCLERQSNPDGWVDLQVHGVNVHQNWRNRGVGKGIVAALLQEAEALGARQVELLVQNPIALRIYTAAGFVDTGWRDRERGAPILRRSFEAPKRSVSPDPSPVDLSKVQFLDRGSWDAAY